MDDKIIVEESLIYEGDEDDMEEGKDDEVEESVQVVREDEEQVVIDNEMEKDLEDGEVIEPEEDKKNQKTLRVHLPDLLQGIDGADEFPMNQETIEKLDKRAKRFNVKNDLKTKEVGKLYESLGISSENLEKRNSGKFRLEYIMMYGVFGLHVEEVEEYFEEHSPESVVDMSEDSCIVRFSNALSALRAMMKLSKPIGVPKKEERIVKHVLTADEEPERKVITRETNVEYDHMVHPDDIPVEIPEGMWRLGKHHKKCQAILLKFPSREDFKPAHYLANDRYRPVRGPPAEVLEQEKEMQERNKNFDKKNPWADLCEEWTGPRKSREYEIPIEELDHPPRRFAASMHDWDAPENQDHPVQVKPGNPRKRKILERLDFDNREGSESVTYFSGGEEDNEVEEDKDDMNWGNRLKRPRMGMVADMEEKKTKKPDIRSRIAGATKPKAVLKRKVENSRFVVREEVVEEYLSGSEDSEDIIYAEEARNVDLRHALTMKIENRPIKEAVRPSKKFSDRFMGGSKDLDLEQDTGEDLLDIENMKIEIRQYTSGESDMDVDKEEEEEEIRRELRRRREARMAKEREEKKVKEIGDLRETIKKGSGGGDLRDRMTEKREREKRREREHNRDSREKVRVKIEKEDGAMRSEIKETEAKKKSSKVKSMDIDNEKEKKLIEQRKKEIEELKREEKKLLEQKERKLREMQQKRDDDKLRAKRERDREREKREREKERERQRELDRLKAKEKLREKERARRSRRRSGSSEESSSDSDSSSSDDSDSDSSSSSDSSSDDSSSDSDSESSGSESESEKRKKTSSRSSKKTSAKKEPEKKRSSKPESSSKDNTKSSKESSKVSVKPSAEDQKKASELRDKLKVYLNKAKAAKEEKKDKK